MKRLVALCELYCNGSRHAGDTFEASENDAKILVGIGKARLEHKPPEQPAPAAPQPQAQALKAEEPPPPKPMTTATNEVLTQVKRRYRRRDMRAER